MDYDPDELLREVSFEIRVPAQDTLDLVALTEFTGAIELATHVASAEIAAVFDTHDKDIQVQGQNLVNKLGRSWRGLGIRLKSASGSEHEAEFFLSNGNTFPCQPILHVDSISYASPLKMVGRGPLLIIAIAVAYGEASFELEWGNDLEIKVEYQGGLAKSAMDTQLDFSNSTRLNRLTIQSAERVSNKLEERKRGLTRTDSRS